MGEPARVYIKLNIDGVVKGDPSIAAAGRLIRDDIRRWLDGFMHNIRVCTSIGAELCTMKSIFEFTWKIRFRRLIF